MKNAYAFVTLLAETNQRLTLLAARVGKLGLQVPNLYTA